LQRGLPDIEDEITFAKLNGYVFHVPQGFWWDETELKIVQDFVCRMSQERQLAKRLHAIWFVHLGAWNRNFTRFAF